MKHDFSARHRGAVYFGLSLEESADAFGKQDAWQVLKDALDRTMEEDVRSAILDAALEYLEEQAAPVAALNDFRKALLTSSPQMRYKAMSDAMRRIRKGLIGYR